MPKNSKPTEAKFYWPDEWQKIHEAKRKKFGGGPRKVRRRMELDQRRNEIR